MMETSQNRFYIAVDAGGTQLRAACYLNETFEPIKVQRISTRDQETSPTERLIYLIGKVWPQNGDVLAIALAVPGAVNPHEGIVYTSPNIPGWVDFPLRKIISERFNVPVAVGNDANIAALGEWKYGAGQGYKNLLYFTISTGIGGGVIEDGRLVLGQRGLAGEVGHITVEPDGPVCGCGQHGHLEAIASGPAIARWIERQIESGEASLLKEQPVITAKDAAEAAAKGDQLAKAAFARAGFWFGRSLADFLHLFNPDIVVIGGGVSRCGDLFFLPMQESMKKHVISPRYYENLKITRASLGDDAGLTGALALAQSIQKMKALV
jgi:glucokinase